MKNPEVKTTDMQLESEEEKAKLHVKEESNKVAETTEQPAIDKEHVSEQTSKERQVSIKIQEESRTISQEKEEVLENLNEIQEVDEQEDNDIKLTFEIEQSFTRNGGEELDDKRVKDDAKGKELPTVQGELKNGTNEKEEMQSEAQTDIESCSVDIVESTTSEVSETSGIETEISESISQSDMQKDKEKIDDNLNNDASFISYDSSIMLKDVQIRLNDCLKDNSKLFDENNAEATPNHLKDMSFGKTLRNISGRHSIGRMRHVTMRERRISPNNSLFVNTSTISIPHDEGTESKILHYNSDLLSDSFPTNGSPLDRKRKIETENPSSFKKQKTDGESLLNTSIGLLKSFRNIQVSTPKVTSYKFESKLDISGIKDDDNKITVEPTESTKKWCVIM